VLRIENDGVGIDPETLASGRDGHFGLKGMRDRPLRCGGVLEIGRAAASGTSVVLRVPARRAYVREGLLDVLLRRLGTGRLLGGLPSNAGRRQFAERRRYSPGDSPMCR
jgi:hypothetical protein